MLMLALLLIGLLALRCVDTLATRFGDLLFNFFVLIIGTLVARTLLLHLSLLDARTPLATAARTTCCSLTPLLLLPLISLLLILLYILFLFLLCSRSRRSRRSRLSIRLRCVPGATCPRLTDRAACLNICGRICDR